MAVVRLENISRGCFIYLYFVVSCGRRAGDRESRHLTWSAVSNRSNDWAADWLHIIPRFHFFSYPFLLLCVCVSVCSILGVGLEVIAVAAVSAIALILRKAGVNWMKGKPLDAVGLFRRPPPPFPPPPPPPPPPLLLSPPLMRAMTSPTAVSDYYGRPHGPVFVRFAYPWSYTADVSIERFIRFFCAPFLGQGNGGGGCVQSRRGHKARAPSRNMLICS